MTAMDTERRTLRRIITVRRLVMSVLLAVAVGALVFSASVHHDIRPGTTYPAAIDTVFPAPGTPSVERQTTVFAELRSGYDGALEIDDHKIPDDQLEKLSTGNTRLAYTPGPGKELSAFRPDRNCATVTYWQTGQPPETGDSFSWCFNLG